MASWSSYYRGSTVALPRYLPFKTEYISLQLKATHTHILTQTLLKICLTQISLPAQKIYKLHKFLTSGGFINTSHYCCYYYYYYVNSWSSVCCIPLKRRMQTMVLEHNKFDKFCFWDKTFRSMSAVPNKVSFCRSLMVIVPGIFPLCFSSPFLISPIAPITTGIISVFIPPILIVSIQSLGSFGVFQWSLMRCLCQMVMPYLWVYRFWSYGLWSLYRSCWLLFLYLCICIVQSIVASLFSVTVVAGSCSYHFSNTWIL